MESTNLLINYINSLGYHVSGYQMIDSDEDSEHEDELLWYLDATKYPNPRCKECGGHNYRVKYQFSDKAPIFEDGLKLLISQIENYDKSN